VIHIAHFRLIFIPFLFWTLQVIMMHNNVSHNNRPSHMFQLLSDTNLTESQNVEPSSNDSKSNSLESIGSQFECAQWMDSNPSIEPQLCLPLFTIPPSFQRLNIHNALPNTLQTSLFACRNDVVQFCMNTPTLIISSKLQWTLQSNGEGNHEHNGNVCAFKTTWLKSSWSSRPGGMINKRTWSNIDLHCCKHTWTCSSNWWSPKRKHRKS
jgi:hypothetical protein